MNGPATVEGVAHPLADPHSERLRLDHESKSRVAQDAWREFAARRGQLQKDGRDLVADKGAFGELRQLHEVYETASKEAEQAKDTYIASLEGKAHVGVVGGGYGDAFGRWLAAGVKSILEGSGSGSYITPPAFLPRVWDRLRAASVGLRSGFTTLDTDSKELHIPRVTGDASAAWVAEGATISPSDPTINEVVATPRKLAALVQLSNEALMDSTPAAGDVVMRNLIQSLALRLDLGFYEGSGTAPEIRGLKNQSGTQTVSMGTNGATPANLDPFADAIGALAEQNAEATAIVMHPRTWKTLSKLKEAVSGNNKPLLQESAGSGGQGIDRRIYGVSVFLTSQLSITETQGTASNASSAYVYQSSEVVAVRREEFRIELDSSRLFNQDMSEIRGVMRFDLVLPNAAAVTRIIGLLP